MGYPERTFSSELAEGCNRPDAARLVSKYAMNAPLDLNNQERSRLFLELYRINEIGLPMTDRGALLANAPAQQRARLGRLAQLVGDGNSLAVAGEQAGVFLPWEVRVIEAGEESGELSRVLKRLSAEYEERHRRARLVRTRLAMPLGMLVLGMFILPLPALVLGDLGGGEYLLKTLGPIITVVLVYRLVSNWRRSIQRSQDALWSDALLESTPVFGSLWTLENRRQLVNLLGLLLGAGLPADTALKTTIHALPNRLYRRRMAGAFDMLATGASLTDTLRRYGMLDGLDKALIHVGEAAGSLDVTLAHLGRALDERAEREQAFVAEWIPRMVYFGVLAMLALSVIRQAGSAFSTGL